MLRAIHPLGITTCIKDGLTCILPGTAWSLYVLYLPSASASQSELLGLKIDKYSVQM